MNGPEHYREAERLLAMNRSLPNILARAQAHATLALVAATIEASAGDVSREWLEVAR